MGLDVEVPEGEQFVIWACEYNGGAKSRRIGAIFRCPERILERNTGERKRG
jgi:hypothetical protein